MILIPMIPDDVLLRRFADFALERGEVPTEADLSLKSKEDPTVPGKSAVSPVLGKPRCNAPCGCPVYCDGNPDFATVVELTGNGTSSVLDRRMASIVSGLVYFLRAGRTDKIGPYQCGWSPAS